MLKHKHISMEVKHASHIPDGNTSLHIPPHIQPLPLPPHTPPVQSVLDLTSGACVVC